MRSTSRVRFAVLALGLLIGLVQLPVRALARVDAEQLATRHGFAPSQLGFLLFDPATGAVLDEHDADTAFIPASTTKVATALAALDVLGADFRFATTLLATGDVVDGTLRGDLYLRGGGDPTLSSDDLRALVAELRAAGVRRVDGALFFDETLYPRAPEIDALQPEAAPYNPAVSALSVNYNRIELRWRRDAGGRRTTEVLSPADGGALPVRSIGTGVLDADLDPRIEFLFSAEPGPRWLLSPRRAPSGSAFLPVRGAPGPVVAERLVTLAERAGVTLPAPRRGTAPDEARVVARHESPPLREVAAGLLRFSNNLTAELTGLATSHRLTGIGLALEASARRVAAWWQDRLPQTSFRGFVAANHSGLSSVTRVTPRQMASILRYGAAGGASGVRLQEILALRERGDDAHATPAGGPVLRAKSGTLLYADGLVGFLTTRAGRELGFAILLTDAGARARLDATRDVRIAASPPEAVDWTARAKALERELVARWADG
jgi:serine-type D-Ala-D-Ala carboxypeptidase/endopeptidase (penicillin-binding protein 4)